MEVAMLVKWIVCEVAESKRAQFSLAQEQWAAVAGLEGFVGQVGGWNMTRACQACILALWRGPKSYEAFMTGEHDVIARKNAQADSYHAITTSLFEVVWEMPGRASSLLQALRCAGFLRTADCTVRAGRQEHFLEVQRCVWTPAMGETDGMLGGVFSRLRGGDRRYHVATFWTDQAAHEAYVANRLPHLRAKAHAEQDIERIEGRVICLERSWRVIASRALAQ
jgi:hypothetical protein